MLLHDMPQCSVNRMRELYTILSTDGRDRFISILDILSRLLKPNNFYTFVNNESCETVKFCLSVSFCDSFIMLFVLFMLLCYIIHTSLSLIRSLFGEIPSLTENN